MVGTELPQYQCHKKVRAAKITGFRQNGNIDMPDLLLGEIGAIVTLLPDWHEKHKPQIGGYYVVYEDGYKSYSPAEAFESGYTAIEARNKVAERQLEAAITAARANVAPRITPADIEANIAYEEYFTAAQGVAAENAAFGNLGDPGPKCLELLTFCVLVLRNGTKLVGVNYGAIDPAQHSAERGRYDARADAVRQVWPLMGYELRSKLAGA